MTKQKGFTLIELVVVIVILGILAATALPKFIDVSADARNAAASGVAGAISSGTSINYAGKKMSNANATAVSAANVCTAAILGNFVSGATLVDGAAASTTADGKYTVLTGTTAACNGATDDGKSKSCSIQANGPSTTAQTVTVICAQ